MTDTSSSDSAHAAAASNLFMFDFTKTPSFSSALKDSVRAKLGQQLDDAWNVYRRAFEVTPGKVCTVIMHLGTDKSLPKFAYAMGRSCIYVDWTLFNKLTAPSLRQTAFHEVPGLNLAAKASSCLNDELPQGWATLNDPASPR